MPLYTPVNLTAVTTNVIPDADNSRSLGSTTLNWAAIHTRAFTSNVANGATAIGAIFDTVNDLVHASAKWAEWRSATVVKLSLKNDNTFAPGTGLGVALQSNSGNGLIRCNDTEGSRFGFGANTVITDSTRHTVAGAVRTTGRVLEAQGADVASANNLVLGADGNYFVITGTTQVNLLANTSWLAGSVVRLRLASGITIKHNQTPSGANVAILLAGSVDLVTASIAHLSLIYDGTSWRELGRSAA